MSNNLYSRITDIYIYLTELVCDWAVNSQIKATLLSSTCSCWRLAGTAWLRGVWADPDLCAEKTKSNVLIGRKWKAAFHAVGLLGKDTAIRMGLLFLGFPWSVLSVIGLPGTAFPEKWLQRVFKEKYLSSNCFGGNSSEMFQDGTPLLGVSSGSGHLDALHRVSSGLRVPCVQQCGKKRLQSKRSSKFSKWGGSNERIRS